MKSGKTVLLGNYEAFFSLIWAAYAITPFQIVFSKYLISSGKKKNIIDRMPEIFTFLKTGQTSILKPDERKGDRI